SAPRFAPFPTGERLRNSIHQRHSTLSVSRDYSVSDAIEGDTKPFTFISFFGFTLLSYSLCSMEIFDQQTYKCSDAIHTGARFTCFLNELSNRLSRGQLSASDEHERFTHFSRAWFHLSPPVLWNPS